MKFEYELLEKIMKHESVNGKVINMDSYGFSRDFAFTVGGVDYRINWYHNQSTLFVGDLQVMFNNIELSNTWPSPARARLKMQFRDSSENCVAIIPIEWHEKLEKE